MARKDYFSRDTFLKNIPPSKQISKVHSQSNNQAKVLRKKIKKALAPKEKVRERKPEQKHLRYIPTLSDDELTKVLTKEIAFNQFRTKKKQKSATIVSSYTT